MIYASITAAIAALLALGAAIAVLFKLASLRGLIAAQRREPPSARTIQPAAVLSEGIERAIQDLDRRQAAIEAVIVEVRRDVGRLVARAATPPAVRPEPPTSHTPPLRPEMPVRASAVEAPGIPERLVERPIAAATFRAIPIGQPASAAPAVRPSPSPEQSARIARLLDSYRELVARPQRHAINSWADDNRGVGVEAMEDGSLRELLPEDRGLLTLLPLDASNAMVVPGGRMVVDFGTSYATTLQMRPVTRDLFDLSNDGTGLFRLVEPALVERSDGEWRLARPGSITGLVNA